ncbi:MAG: hypothetical protein WA970_21440, partial [Gammaproteobacteria bacterium]
MGIQLLWDVCWPELGMGARLVGWRSLGISRLGVSLWRMGPSGLVGTTSSPSARHRHARRELWELVTACLAPP